MEKKYLSDCIRYTTDIAPYPFIQIYSGVGSGKNTFVDALAKGYEESQPDGRMETLEPKRVLCITSRRAKVDELKNAEDVAYGTQVLEYESLDYVEDLDSYFASKRELSCNGIWGTIPIYQRSIACTNAAIERYLEKHYRADKAEDFRLPKNGHAIDLMDRCVRVEPKHVLLADKAEVTEDMKQRLAAGEKVIYFANRVSTVLNLYRNAFQEYKNEAAVSFSSDDELDKQEKETREILEKRDEIQAYIAENQKLPDDIRLFLTTSKNKEGINIKNADIKTMYIETHSQIDAIQMAGRVRAGLDQLYIVTDAVQNSAPESPFEYELSGRADLKASLNALLAQKKEDAGIAEGAPWSVQEHEEIRSYIAYIQKKFPHFCYDYFADTFCLYSDRHSSRRYYAEQNAAFVRAKEEGSLLSLVGKWFPQADIAFANKKQQRIDAYFHAQDVLNVPLEKSAVQEIKAYLETVIGQPFRSFNHFMRPYGYAIRKASGNTTSPNYGKQIITRIGTDKT